MPRSHLLAEIATELQTPAHILDAIDRYQHQARATHLSQPFVAPQTSLERTLARIWTHVLSLDQVGLIDNFFALGGSSLQGIHLLSRIYQTFKVPLPLEALFENPTVAALAQIIAAKSPVEMGPITAWLHQTQTSNHQASAPTPLSFAQQRLWFLHQFQTDNPAYNISFAVRLDGQLNIEALRRALLTIVQRHEILRTTLTTIDGRPGQVVHPPDALEFTLENVTTHLSVISSDEGARNPPRSPFATNTLGISRQKTPRNDMPEQLLENVYDLDDARIASPGQKFKLYDLPVIDIAAQPETRREIILTQLTTAEARYAFDLAGEALLRAIVVRWQDESPVHILLITTSHIISDHWSMQLLFRELSRLYNGYLTDQPVTLPDIPLHYADFARWQRHQWANPDATQQRLLDYWQRQLHNLPHLQLPTDYPHPPTQTFRGSVHTFTLADSVTRALHRLSQQAEVTLFMTLLAAFYTLLYRYTNQVDLPLGTPIANRSQPELDQVMGLLVNTLVLRGDLSGDPPFLELLERVRRMALDSYAHQDLPFARLVEQIQPERDPGRSPLFQVMFSLQNEPLLHDLTLTGITTERVTIEPGVSQFDVSLEMVETAAGLSGIFEFNTDLFASTTIQRLAHHFQTLLAGIITHPHHRLSQLPLLTPAERQQLLAWGDQPFDFLTDCVQDLFERQVQHTPGAVAIIQPLADPQPIASLHNTGLTSPETVTKALTYQELNEKANQLAHHLQRLGVGVEVTVGLCVERSPEMIIGLLGILKAGGAYVPLDPAYPPDRLAFMLTDTQSAIIVTQSHLLPFLPLATTSAEIVCLDTDWPHIAAQPSTTPAHQATPDNLAYIMYTSGSSGRPKGVMIEHRALSWYTQTAAQAYQVTAADRVLQFSSVSFDISVEEIYPCLTQGGTLVLRTETMLKTMPDFLQTCTRLGLTAFFLPTAFWHDLALALAEDPALLPPSLRLVSFGGEKVLPERVTAWRSQMGDRVQLWNGYGPTETTVVAALYQVSGAGAEAWQAASIGRAIAGAQLYIVDSHLQPVPIGVPGELYIGGAGVARGYLNQPRLTAERFIPHPFADFGTAQPTDASPRTLYRTGDLAR
ncbi:MAG: amino acid adenylation domain-containing protein, partial [Anaerolineae bacterium]|nr:amino acid adenylation domain-containing protein [Anaerolineae bacterium]